MHASGLTTERCPLESGRQEPRVHPPADRDSCRSVANRATPDHTPAPPFVFETKAQDVSRLRSSGWSARSAILDLTRVAARQENQLKSHILSSAARDPQSAAEEEDAAAGRP